MTVMVEDNNARTPGRTELSDLLRTRRAELRMSYRQMEERTKLRADGDPIIKRGTLENLEKAVPTQLWTPRLPELEALARAYELPLERVQDAAGSQYLGMDRVDSAAGAGRAYVKNADKLTPEQLEQIQKLVDLFANDTTDGASGAQG